MKKVLTVLVLFVTVLTTLGLKTEAAGTGNLVIHFKAWDTAYDYSVMGSHYWGTGAVGSAKLKDGVDDFGAYWNYNDVPVGAEVNFIAVEWKDGAQNWDRKFTQDVKLGTDIVKEGKTVHIYVFQGAETKEGQPGFFAADPDKINLLVAYYDPANAYEEKIGVHHWGMTTADPSWGSPKPLTNAGVAQSGYPVKAIILAQNSGAGLLVYAGTNDNKKTGDINPQATTPVGQADVVYVVNAGDAKTDNTNVFRDYEDFAAEAFSFKLKPFVSDGMTGTFAQNPTDIYVETSAPITSPYPAATDKEAAMAEIKSWFTVKEKTGENTYGPALEIERVDFALSAQTLNTFVVVLKNTSKLDNKKEYEVFFNLNHPEAVVKQVEVTLELTAPANTPVGETPAVIGSFVGWDATKAIEATKVGDKWVATFMVDIQSAYTTFEYKWTRGSWATEEFISSNRKFTIVSNQDEATFVDVVQAWADVNPPAEKYAAPVRDVEVLSPNIKASIEIAMDLSKPELTFISPSSIAGKPANQRIIEVAWGKAFDQNLFPGYRVTDDRDGDITALVYVPKGEYSKIDTSKEGDYTIMLQVEDKWGNVTQETFIFRVVKK